MDENLAGVVELEDTAVLSIAAERRGGSTPSLGIYALHSRKVGLKAFIL